MKPRQRPLLHCHIGLDVLMCSCRTLVAKPKRNDADVDAGLLQMYCRRVTNLMRRDLAVCQVWAGFRANLDGVIQSLRHVLSRLGSNGEAEANSGFRRSQARIALTVERHRGKLHCFRPLPCR